VKLAANAALHRLAAESWQLKASRNALLQLNILQTVVFPTTKTRVPRLLARARVERAVCKELMRVASSFQLPASSKRSLEAGSWELGASSISFEF
jgi:hypothetical protein